VADQAAFRRRLPFWRRKGNGGKQCPANVRRVPRWRNRAKRRHASVRAHSVLHVPSRVAGLRGSRWASEAPDRGQAHLTCTDRTRARRGFTAFAGACLIGAGLMNAALLGIFLLGGFLRGAVLSGTLLAVEAVACAGFIGAALLGAALTRR
jgi:hypothetical protein